METQITTFGALLGLVVAIILIIKKIQPAYSLIFGALVGGLLGGAGLVQTVDTMIRGAQDITPSIIRILTSGVLAGVLIETGAAAKIADQIISILGEKRALMALSLSTMILTSVGVFIDISVITVSPIALAIAKKLKYSKFVVLLAMIGGGKSGNMISPNPNTIAVAENFGVELGTLITANIIPAIFGFIMTVVISNMITKKFLAEETEIYKEITEVEKNNKEELPSFLSAMIGPLVAIVLLSLRPLIGFAVDPLVALPLGGIIGALAMGKIKNINEYITFGISKMMPVAILLVGTGTIAGIIKASGLQQTTVNLLDVMNMPGFLLAPISGVLMGAATASTTAGATIASATFAPVIMAVGVSQIAGGAMLHSGATVLDTLPHGSFFHATGGSVNMKINERLKLIPYEALIGFTICLVSTIMWGIIL